MNKRASIGAVNGALLFLTAFLSVQTPAVALAQQTFPPSAAFADPKAFELSQQLVALIDMRSVFNSMFLAMSKNMLPVIARDNPHMTPAIQKLVSDEAQKAFMSHESDLELNAAILYAQNYSAYELQQIVGFYQSPVGQKMLKSTPEMMQKSMEINMPVIKQSMDEAKAGITAALKKSGMKVPKEISL